MSKAPRIPQELKEEAIRRMLPPNEESPQKVAADLGINYDTIRHLKSDALRGGRSGKKAVANGDSTGTTKIIRSSMNSADKFQIVLETYAMTETELGEYARQRGLYVEEIKAWREACKNANGGTNANEQRLNQELKTQQQENKELKREITRKDKTIAEVTALLMLSKKAQAIWGEVEDA